MKLASNEPSIARFLSWGEFKSELNKSFLVLDLTYSSITISCTTASERKSTKAHIRSKRKCVSGCSRYMASRGVFRYHMLNGFSSVGGPKKLKLKHLRSGGSKFDSIMAMLCKG